MDRAGHFPRFLSFVLIPGAGPPGHAGNFSHQEQRMETDQGESQPGNKEERSDVGLLVPPSVNLPPPGPPTSFQRAAATPPSVVETDKEYEIEDVLPSLHEALNNCRSFVQKQVCDDIHKRLVILQEMWTQGKLSSPVRKRMGILTEELKSQHWDEADEIHRSLMVDHVAEVSQWMVGVKRLIAETKNLPGGDPLQ